MSELKSVLLFFGILVGFIIIVAFIFGRLTWPFGNKNNTVAVAVTPTPAVPTPTPAVPTPTPAKQCSFFGLFCKPAPTPTSTVPTIVATTPTPLVIAPTGTMTGGTGTTTNTVSGVTTIPETGNPTLLLLIPGALASAGMWFRKRS